MVNSEICLAGDVLFGFYTFYMLEKTLFEMYYQFLLILCWNTKLFWYWKNFKVFANFLHSVLLLKKRNLKNKRKKSFLNVELEIIFISKVHFQLLIRFVFNKTIKNVLLGKEGEGKIYNSHQLIVKNDFCVSVYGDPVNSNSVVFLKLQHFICKICRNEQNNQSSFFSNPLLVYQFPLLFFYQRGSLWKWKRWWWISTSNDDCLLQELHCNWPKLACSIFRWVILLLLKFCTCQFLIEKLLSKHSLDRK